ncbi:MAG: ABC transporter permease [Candidatus Bathyarchaeota archaeon]|nr:ABC transporter permease [Candidatus Bathyarchaeota archaeon]
MPGLFTIAKKELLDIVTEKKFLLIFATLLIVVLVSTFQGAQNFMEMSSSSSAYTTLEFSTSGNNSEPQIKTLSIGSTNLYWALYSMVKNISTVGGLLAIAISFDAINKERLSGSLKTLLSYPVYRDSVLGGKYLGGFAAITIVTLTTFMAGIGVFVGVTGTPLTFDNTARLLIFLGMSVVYLALFLGIGLLLSIVLPEPSTSLLAAIIIWLASTQLIPNLGWAIASIVYPFSFTTSGNIGKFGPSSAHELLRKVITGISPSASFEQTVSGILSTSKMEFSGYTHVNVPISLGQALMTCLPNLIYLVALLVVVFAACYVTFTRQEIR